MTCFFLPRALPLAMLAATACITGSASAATPSAEAPPAQMEQLLVTGSYAPTADITASVTVLDAQLIAALNKRSVAALLKTVPGLLVEEQGGPGGLTAVSIRGGEANFTLVLLDGVALNDPTNTRGGGFDVANLNPTQIERIEVVRGAQSSIYGSDALAGVINIISRQARAGHQQRVNLEVGEDDFRDAGISFSGVHADLDYRLALTTRDEGEPVPGSTRENDSAHLHLGWRVNQQHTLAANLRYQQGERSAYPEQSGGPEFALIDALDHAEYEDRIIALDWRAALSPAWNSTLTAQRLEHHEDVDSPGIPPFSAVPPNGARTQYTRDDLRWINSVLLAEHYQLDTGGDLRQEQGRAEGYVEFFGDRMPTDFALDRNTLGVFATLSATPVASTVFNTSVRYDDPEGFSSETSWRLGVRHAVTPTLHLSANWGEAYKLPSFFALGNALVGNPDLKPEKATGSDIGLEWAIERGLHLDLTLFYNDFKDLVDFDDATFRNVNRGQVETQGVEMALAYAPSTRLSVIGTGTYTDIDVREDTRLTGRPQWSAGLAVQWQLALAWDTSVDYRYTSGQWSISRHTGQERAARLDDYYRLDWVLRWQAAEGVQLRASLDNLLDARYDTAVGFAAPGRAARVGVQLEF